MFPRLAKFAEDSVLPAAVQKLVLTHLEHLQTKIDLYFADIDVASYDWIRNPYSPYVTENAQLSPTEEDELADLRNDRTVKLKHAEIPLDLFWISTAKEYSQISTRALRILLQFSTSYLCELGFSALVNIKNKKRERLKTIDDEMRVCLSEIRPDIDKICASHQAHISH